jgi:glycosyltransferase involved in cell wall biosynthesis
MLKATVVISNYNYGKYVSSAMESALAQTEPCQIIIVDDCSTDDSWDKIKKFAHPHRDDNVVAIRLKTNSEGNARGKNVGIALSKTQYITCLDSDDMLLPQSVQHRLEDFSRDKTSEFVHGRALTVANVASYDILAKAIYPKGKTGGILPSSIEGRLRSSIKKNPTICKCNPNRCTYKSSCGLSRNALEWHSLIEASTVLADINLYHKYGLYDEDLKWKIDREMWRRWLLQGVNRGFFDAPVSFYRTHRKQITKNPDIKKPAIVNRKFYKACKVRFNNGITSENTLLLSEYNAEQYIEEMVGKIL